MERRREGTVKWFERECGLLVLITTDCMLELCDGGSEGIGIFAEPVEVAGDIEWRTVGNRVEDGHLSIVHLDDPVEGVDVFLVMAREAVLGDDHGAPLAPHGPHFAFVSVLGLVLGAVHAPPLSVNLIHVGAQVDRRDAVHAVPAGPECPALHHVIVLPDEGEGLAAHILATPDRAIVALFEMMKNVQLLSCE